MINLNTMKNFTISIFYYFLGRILVINHFLIFILQLFILSSDFLASYFFQGFRVIQVVFSYVGFIGLVEKVCENNSFIFYVFFASQLVGKSWSTDIIFTKIQFAAVFNLRIYVFKGQKAWRAFKETSFSFVWLI